MSESVVLGGKGDEIGSIGIKDHGLVSAGTCILSTAIQYTVPESNEC